MSRSLARRIVPWLSLMLGLGLTAVLASGQDLATSIQIWATFGTLAAVVVALRVSSIDQRARREESAQRAAAAAILVSQRAYTLRAMLSGFVPDIDEVKSNPEAYLPWLRETCEKFRALPELLREAHLPYAVDLPPADLYDLVIADQWFRNFQGKILPDPSAPNPVWLANLKKLLDEFSTGYNLIISSTDRLHILSNLGNTAPWIGHVPTWATPERA